MFERMISCCFGRITRKHIFVCSWSPRWSPRPPFRGDLCHEPLAEFFIKKRSFESNPSDPKQVNIAMLRIDHYPTVLGWNYTYRLLYIITYEKREKEFESIEQEQF